MNEMIKDAFQFIDTFNSVSDQAHANAVSKGFWDEDRDDKVGIGLMHCELSEAFEAIRHGNPPDDHIPEFSGVEAEFADVIIRIMDTARKRNYRVAEAIIAKMIYNSSRPRLHGKLC